MSVSLDDKEFSWHPRPTSGVAPAPARGDEALAFAGCGRSPSSVRIHGRRYRRLRGFILPGLREQVRGGHISSSSDHAIPGCMRARLAPLLRWGLQPAAGNVLFLVPVHMSRLFHQWMHCHGIYPGCFGLFKSISVKYAGNGVRQPKQNRMT